MNTIKTDVMILGAGAAGFGACYRLTKNGICVVVADANPGFGGTAVFAGITCFEPGVSLDGVHSLLAERLLKRNAAQVQKTVPNYRIFRDDPTICNPGENEQKFAFGVSPDYPWGLSVNSGDPYKTTLKRCKKFCSTPFDWRRFMTDEDELSKEMGILVSENMGDCVCLFGYKFLGCRIQNRKIISVQVSNGDCVINIIAKCFMDCSGSIVLARDAGCKCELGNKGDINSINGASLVIRVSKTKDPIKLSNYSLSNDNNWLEVRKKRISCFNMYPDGDINVNMLPTMTGKEYIQYGKDAYSTCIARMCSYWKYIQDEKGMADYKIVKIFPMIGIREDYHLVGRKILSHNDIIKGIEPGKKYIAIADHPLDMHGVSCGISGELEKPYGIPIEVTIPNEYENLFVVCRGSSFTYIASSSARLTRTMMSMGEGVAQYIIGCL